ncbi:CBS domain-containing protein [Litoribrevibacter albus]|uniref:CBS domain-containing protein n=1 Tax=Litoribrevibacter albus TaxID=1473156 RepID=A0AA37SB91_9GAMM|nr:CBS domain-containing protein [Litoribrevibacter albus]GLQ32071.1 CBS domain-containing protein [Litoribrevibacter albus]
MTIESIKVRSCMDESILPLTPDTPLIVATTALCKNKLTGLPVVDSSLKVIGFLSEQDCIGKILNESFYGYTDATVKDVMQTDIVSISPETSIIDLAQQMKSNRPRVYPVVESERLLGVISRTDVLTALKRHIKKMKSTQI